MPSGTQPASNDREPDLERLRALSLEINRRFPPRLDHTVLVLYDLDPEHLQVQWSILAEDLAKACGAFPCGPADLRQVLRLCRLDGEGRAEVVDRDVTMASASTLHGHRCLAPEEPDAEYECELGLESTDGGWLMLVRSNRVRLAGPKPMEQGDAEEADRAHTLGAEGEGSADLDKLGRRQVEPALAADGESLYPVFPSPSTADDVPAAWLEVAISRSGADAPENLGTEAPPNSGERSYPPPGPVQSVPPAHDSAAMPPPLLPSTQHLAQSPSDTSLPRYDPRAALSSAALHGAAGKPAELDMQAELVVQGCARPGALIDLFGLSIRVGEDGLFSVRCPIADPVILSLALGGHPAAPPRGPEQQKP